MNFLETIFSRLDSENEFIAGSVTYQALLRWACAIREGLAAEQVCLAAEDRAVVASCIMARVLGGPIPIFPFDLTDDAIAKLKDSTGIETVVADRERKGCIQAGDFLDRTKRVDAGHLLGGEDVLLWLFTGGTTGQPQLWSKTIDNVFTEANDICRFYQITDQDIVISTVPPFHIYGLLFSVIVPLVAGAKVIEQTSYFPQEVCKIMREQQCTVLVSSPAHYKTMSQSGMTKGSMRLAFSSGGFLAEADAQTFYEQTGVGVTEVYGSTETGGIAARCPAMGQSLWKTFAAVKIDVQGERLAVSSPYLAPQLKRDSKGFFLTSDRVRALGSRQTFELLGRADSIIKVAGKRVDLLEVKATLDAIDGIENTLIFSIPTDGLRGNEVAALVQSRLSRNQVQKIFSQSLPAAQRPTKFSIVASLPLTAMGKPDLAKARQILQV
jgi:acyl-coenzyme A synthetase/AMP-(fatty) acid ligase